MVYSPSLGGLNSGDSYESQQQQNVATGGSIPGAAVSGGGSESLLAQLNAIAKDPLRSALEPSPLGVPWWVVIVGFLTFPLVTWWLIRWKRHRAARTPNKRPAK